MPISQAGADDPDGDLTTVGGKNFLDGADHLVVLAGGREGQKIYLPWRFLYFLPLPQGRIVATDAGSVRYTG